MAGAVLAHQARRPLGPDADRLVGALTSGKPAEDEFEERIRQDFTLIYKGFLKDHYVQKPLVAAVEGYCYAGGMEILQAFDIRVVADPGTAPDVVVHGPAGSLDAWLWRRGDDRDLRISGDRNVYDHFRKAADISADAAWQGEVAGPERTLHPFTDVLDQIARVRSGIYVDVHVWTFTPGGFVELIDDLGRLGPIGSICVLYVGYI